MRLGTCSLLSGICLFLAACGGGGGSPPATLDILAPDAPLTVALGAPVEITYRGNRTGTTLLADRDGDPATTGDQYVIAANRPDPGGAEERVVWDTTGVDGGTYRILGRTDAGAIAAAAGTVFVNPPPTLDLLAPDFDTLASASASGAVLRIRYVADDLEPHTSVALFADEDGDPSTTIDRIAIGSPVPHSAGLEVERTWSPGALAGDLYSIYAIADDGVNPPVIAIAGGRLRAAAPFIAPIDGPSPTEMAVFDDGSFVVTGSFWGRATWRVGEPDEFSHRSQAQGFSSSVDDIFIARYSSDGELQWVRIVSSGATVGTRGIEYSLTIAALPDGSCIFGGQFTEPLQFGEGAGSIRLEPDPNSATGIGFLAKCDADGNFLWATRLGGFHLFVADVAVDTQGNAFAVGRFYQQAWLGDAAEERITTPVSGMFVAAYDPHGALRWVRYGECSNLIGPELKVAAMAGGGCAVAGLWQKDVAFGEGANRVAWTASSGSAHRPLVARFADDGGLLWARMEENRGSHRFLDVATSPDGAIVVHARISGNPSYGIGEPTEVAPDPGDYIVRYGAAGGFEWMRPIPAVPLSRIAIALDGAISFAAVYSGPLVTLDGVAYPPPCSLSATMLRATFEPTGALRRAATEGCGNVALKTMAVQRDGAMLAVLQNWTREWQHDSGATIAPEHPHFAIRIGRDD